MSLRKLRDALVLMGAFVALLWVLQVFNWADGYRLDVDFGIVPHNVEPAAGDLHRAVPARLVAAHRGQHGAVVRPRRARRVPRDQEVPADDAHRGGGQRAGGVAVPERQRADRRGQRADLRILRLRRGPRLLRQEPARHRCRDRGGPAVLDDPAGGDPRDAGDQLDRAPRRAVRRGARGVAAAGADRGRRCFSPSPGRGAACPYRAAPHRACRGAPGEPVRPRTCCASWRRRTSRLGA